MTRPGGNFLASRPPGVVVHVNMLAGLHNATSSAGAGSEGGMVEPSVQVMILHASWTCSVSNLGMILPISSERVTTYLHIVDVAHITTNPRSDLLLAGPGCVWCMVFGLFLAGGEIKYLLRKFARLGMGIVTNVTATNT